MQPVKEGSGVPCRPRGDWTASAAYRLLRRIELARRSFWFDRCWEARIRRIARSPACRNLARPVIHLYAPCYNEQRILPYFMAHYGKFVDEFFIYDNRSTDSTARLLSGYRNVNVIPFDTGGNFSHGERERIKNHAWKASAGKADFVVVCDLDEFLYHPHLDVLLALMKAHGYTLLKPHGYQMAAERLPEFDGTPITTLVTSGMDVASHYSKTILFDPSRVAEIHFSPGCHCSRPKGRIKTFHSSHAKLLHYKYVDREEVLRKTRTYRATISAESRAQGFGWHYQRTDEEVMALFDRILAGARKVI